MQLHCYSINLNFLRAIFVYKSHESEINRSVGSKEYTLVIKCYEPSQRVSNYLE